MSIEQDINKLPYIILPKTKLKILIDSASTKSFIQPKIANKYFKNKIVFDPFKICTPHGSSTENFSIKINAFTIFQNDKQKLKFHLFDFHDHFDLLLGLDNLKLLKSVIDLNKNFLITPKTKIPIHYRDTNENTPCYTIDGKCERIIKVKINNVTNGEAIMPHTKIGHLEIQESLVKVINSETHCLIRNPKDLPCKFSINKKITVEPYNKNESNFHSFNYNKIKFDLSKIRTNHMNHEERNSILKLIKNYSDLFHLKDEPLTFTNKVKHIIRTTDEIPIYAKTYRYP